MMIKFMKYYVTNGAIKARVFYSISSRTDGREDVTIYAKDYTRILGKIFGSDYKDETDSMSDYYDEGSVTLFKDHPLYAGALERALSNQKKVA